MDRPAQTRKRVLIARALEGQGRYQEALREAQAARDITPSDIAALEAFARLAASVGRYADAIEALEMASRNSPGTSTAYEARIGELRSARDQQRMRSYVDGSRPP
jgi:tetratricopeptide (TPR) repeat protein